MKKFQLFIAFLFIHVVISTFSESNLKHSNSEMTVFSSEEQDFSDHTIMEKIYTGKPTKVSARYNLGENNPVMETNPISVPTMFAKEDSSEINNLDLSKLEVPQIIPARAIKIGEHQNSNEEIERLKPQINISNQANSMANHNLRTSQTEKTFNLIDNNLKNIEESLLDQFKYSIRSAMNNNKSFMRNMVQVNSFTKAKDNLKGFRSPVIKAHINHNDSGEGSYSQPVQRSN